MTIQNRPVFVSAEPYHWKTCEDGLRQAQLVEIDDAYGQKRLWGYTRAVASDPKAQRTAVAIPAKLKVAIPSLLEPALMRHRDNPCLRLTPSPSLNHLTVDLWENEAFIPARKGDVYSGALRNGQPHGRGWLASATTQINQVGDFENGRFTGDNNCLEYVTQERVSGFYQGGVSGGQCNGFGHYYSGLKRNDGTPAFEIGTFAPGGGNLFRMEEDGDWYKGSLVDGTASGPGVSYTHSGMKHHQMAAVRVGDFSFRVPDPTNPDLIAVSFSGAEFARPSPAASIYRTQADLRQNQVLQYFDSPGTTAAPNGPSQHLRVTWPQGRATMRVQQGGSRGTFVDMVPSAA